MAGWVRQLLRWVGGAHAQSSEPMASPPAPEALAAAEASGEAADRVGVPEQGPSQAEVADLELRFFEWLVGDAPAAAGTNEVAGEARLLAHLDAVSRSEEQRAELLPRARAVIPELLHSLRDDKQSVRGHGLVVVVNPVVTAIPRGVARSLVNAARDCQRPL